MSAEAKATATPETPLQMYARLRPLMTPKAELFESTACHYRGANGGNYLLIAGVLEWPDKPNTQQDTGQFLLSGEGYNFNPPAGMDTIIDAHYEGSALIVTCWAGKVTGGQYERESNGWIKQFPFKLEVTTAGIKVSGTLDLDLKWLGDGYNYLEIPSGTKVTMQKVAPTGTPTE